MNSDYYIRVIHALNKSECSIRLGSCSITVYQIFMNSYIYSFLYSSIGTSLFCFFSFQQFFLFLPIMLIILLEVAIFCSKFSCKVNVLIVLLKYINPRYYGLIVLLEYIDFLALSDNTKKYWEGLPAI